MSLHVCFVLDNAIQASLGGGFIRILRYSQAMAERGIHFTWITLESDADADFEELWHIKVRRVQIPSSLPIHKKRARLIRAAFEEAARHGAGHGIVSTFACRISADVIWSIWKGWFMGIPSVHHTSMVPGPLPANRAHVLYLKVMTRLFLEVHTAFIPQTLALQRFYTNYFGFGGERTQIISNGVECAKHCPASVEDRREERKKLGLPNDAPIVITTGGVVPRKRTHLLLEAWPEVLRHFPSAKLIIAGTLGRRATFNDAAPSLDEYARKIHDLVSKLAIPESVLLTASHIENVETYLRAADVFAFTSEREGLPNAVLEAMATGLPCVLCPYDGFPNDGEELGRAGEHFLSSEADPASLAKGIIQLLENPERSREIGKAARELMLQTQDLPQIIDQWEALYRRVARDSIK